MVANLLMNKYFTRKSLFLKDLAGIVSKSLISKDRTKGVERHVPQEGK
jgi:hypothetical protein